MTPSQRHALPVSVLTISAASPAMAAAGAAAATPSAGGSYVLELLAILLPLAFIILCLIVLLRFVRRRFGLTGHDAPLSVVQVLALGPRERLVVVRSRAGRAFAVGVSANAVNLVTMLDREDIEPATSADEPAAPSITSGHG